MMGNSNKDNNINITYEITGYHSLQGTHEEELQQIFLEGPLSPEILMKYNLDEGMTAFRTPQKQHRALIELAREADGLVFTARHERTVISYCAFQKPDFPWWQKRCLPEMLELGALETAPAWRCRGITGGLLKALFNNVNFPFFEDFIVFTLQSVYYWDLPGTGLDAFSYRKMMVYFFKKFGFTVWHTKDPEMREHPANLFLARVGRNVKKQTEEAFGCICRGEAVPAAE